MAERLAKLPQEERKALLQELTEENPNLEYSPEFWLRPHDQLQAFRSTHRLVGMLCGRGGGKTRTGAAWAIRKAEENPNCIIHLVGRTVADVRDVMAGGDSGILAQSSPDFRPHYVPSIRKVIWPNGSTGLTFSAESPSQLRGPQAHFSWADEIAAWPQKGDSSGLNAWDQVVISTRLGEHPQVFATTTPKRTKMIRDIVSEAEKLGSDNLVVTGSTFDNRSNLSADYLQTLIDLYSGTALEAQEIHGQLVLVVEGALWRDNDFEIHTWDPDASTLGMNEKVVEATDTTTIVSVDPATTTGGDETGIIVVRSDRVPQQPIQERTATVLADRTTGGPPEEWGKEVVDAFHEFSLPDQTTVVVAEKNQGGEMIRHVIQSIDPAVPVVLISAVKSKAARAEPIVLAYRRNRVSHAEKFDELEGELCLVGETLIETDRGHIRIDEVVPGDRVLTRQGWAPVKWAGKTGNRDHLTTVSHEAGGAVTSTRWHRVWTVNRGFVPAMNVQPSDRLLVRPSPANMDLLLHGEVSGIAVPSRATSVTVKHRSLANFFIGTLGRLTTAPSRKATSSTTGTATSRTAESKTLNFKRIRPTASTIIRGASFLLEWLGFHRKNFQSGCAEVGAVESPVTSSATGVAVPSRALGFEPGSAPPSAASGHTQDGEAHRAQSSLTGDLSFSMSGNTLQSALSPVLVAGVSSDPTPPTPSSVSNGVPGGSTTGSDERLTELAVKIPVYDIKVSEGHPHEFFANGVLVHNTSWEPSSRWSPNRLDSVVHGLTVLLIDDRPIRPYGRLRSARIGEAPTNLTGVVSAARRELGLFPAGSWRGRG